MNKKVEISFRSHVEERINSSDGWYTYEHFKWAGLPYIRRIYSGRFRFILKSIRSLPEETPLTLLDLGCGDGYWLKRIEESGFRNLKLFGVDYNHLRIERARQILSEEVILEVNDVNSLHTEPKDIILSMHVIEHIPDDVGFLKHLGTYLKPGGTLIIGTPNEGNFLMQRRNRKNGIFRSTDHIHFYVEELIIERLRRAGFEITDKYYDPFYFFKDGLFYNILKTDFGYYLLNKLVRWFPYYASGYIFKCKFINTKEENQ